MTWSKEWPKPVEFIDNKLEMPKQPWPTEWPTQDNTGKTISKEQDKATEEEFKIISDSMQAVVKNQTPTHDPYTNPGAYLYYECNCGQRLDPHTKRFAELNNHAMKEGWKIRWGASSYVPYCVECGRDVE